MIKEHTVEISLMKLQRAELALMHIGANLVKAGELMKAKNPASYSLMEADAEGLADALEIIRWLMQGENPNRVS